jgi:UDP-N-acetylmuramoyl-L-alanyl-D-glutamate--2,6-diaminopimelate ligase
MGRAAKQLADRVIVTNDNPRSEDPLRIAEEILLGAGTDVEVDLDRHSAIEAAIGGAEAGDVVVIAGKGHEQGQEIAGVVHPFDDREVAREALRKLAAR